MKRFSFSRIVSVGLYSGLSREEIKRIKFTNGSAFIAGICAILISTIALVSEIISAGEVLSGFKTVSFVILAGVIAFSTIFLNAKQFYFAARLINMLIWWITFTSLSIVMGKNIRVDHYLIATLLLPAVLFTKRMQFYIGIIGTALLIIVVNIIYLYLPPLIDIPEPVSTYRYMVHVSGSVVVIVLLSMYYRWQNTETEVKLSEEMNRHKETSEQLKIANSDKDKFLSIIAHDLRGPIGNIANILTEIDLKDIQPQLLFHLQSTAQNTFELLQDLLTWAQAQKGQIETSPTNFNVKLFFEKSLSSFKFTAKEKNITLEMPDVDKNLFVYADIPSVNTVLRNLVSNALKFTDNGGVISLGAEVENEMIKISVQDTGIGIPEKKLANMFKIGHNISSPGTMNERGTGLGLLLCNEFVKLNNGEIGVETKLNKGSNFWFTLPKGTEFGVNNLPELISEKQLETLIVEDNYLNLQNAITKLSTLNINYDIANNGDEAVKLAESKQYDFILMDIDLPKKNGIEANRIIRKKQKDAIIFALSSYNKTEIQEKANDVVFDEFLDKPLNPDELLNALQRFIIPD